MAELENNIGFWGGMALLISSITGPGLTTIPLLFQQAGWVTPTITFLLFSVVSCLASLFLIETMSTIRGNESFQANVEFSTVAHLYLGKRAHIGMQVMLFLALQSVNISSIIISNQTMDSILIRLFHKTCAVSFIEGWVCATEVTSSGSPFDTYILFSFGYLISAAMVLPLSVMSLVQNIKFQIASVATLFFVIIVWIYIFAKHGLEQTVPPVGNDQSTLIGFVLGNFAFITTIPSFINELSRTVSIHKTIVYPIIVCVILYVIIGLTGASSFAINDSSTLLATLSASNESRVLTTITDILFPVSVLVTSVPVFSIVIRYNLVRGNLCSNRYAILWASVLPWLIIIPLQTKGFLVIIMNWASLIFGSTTNFIIPLVLYISSKVYSASTSDATGGDVFILHSEDTSASTQSPRRSHQTANSRIVPELLTFPPAENTQLPAREMATAPIVTLNEPSDSRRSSILTNEPSDFKKPGTLETGEVELEEFGAGSSSSMPLRVVYSPTVSRRPTVGSSSHSARPSFSDLAVVENDHEGEKAPSPTTAVSLEVAFGQENQPVRRRSSTSATANTTSQHLSTPAWLLPSPRTSNHHSRRNSRNSASLEANLSEIPPTATHFVALPNRRWLKSIVIAKICLIIVSCCVVGNIVYS
ncbi:hypothetical protein LHYA1_G001672 [Lachnellula hyalina]|uniref:Amino acid transporter transmembrane domain-containing protein n=1 Tax=Lachnellula hyalina TaxID=1316788 RepID=A0A8H8U3B4_9HELO|nr:uncharacterized protein LHYA1_G001672 [Lachnellula hyalina]TVY28961.1 hypothetical protein LHYA1_G001672 [Lachnellula hyalina]